MGGVERRVGARGRGIENRRELLLSIQTLGKVAGPQQIVRNRRDGGLRPNQAQPFVASEKESFVPENSSPERRPELILAEWRRFRRRRPVEQVLCVER